MEIRLRLSNNQTLLGVINSPGEKIRAGVVLVHGLGEHIGRYSHLASRFAAGGIAFAAADLPGHGKSDGRRGVIKNYRIVNEMIDILSGEFRKTFPGVPLFLYGHSLGGGIVLQHIISRRPDLNGAVVTSPWLKLSFEPGRSKVILAGIMKSILPSLVQPSGLVADHLSHDAAVVENYRKDPLVHDRISVRLFYDATTAGSYILQNASAINIPVLLMHGSADRITSPDGSRELASGSSRVEIKIWDGGYHELHNEIFREEVYFFIMKWLENHL